MDITRAARLSLVFPTVLLIPFFTDDYELFFYFYLFLGILCIASRWFLGMIALFLFPISIPIWFLIDYLNKNHFELYIQCEELFERYVKVYEKFLNKYFYWLPKESDYFGS